MSKDAQAFNILQAAKHHKEWCGDSECNVSLYMLGMTYSALLGRKLTEEEFAVFH